MNRFAPLGLLLALTPAAFAQSKATASNPWGISSDLPVDPRIRFGRLDNGMRFAWLANPEPDQRCYLRLHVDAGSLAEEEGELGMAHFLEHMAFNGSKHYPPGTLIEWFQKHGMSFGGDTNAHTGFSETVYELDLAKADETSLREGLTVLRDFADGASLLENEVNDEKGVVDSEERERDSADYRVLVKTLDLALHGTRPPARLPIGTKANRDAFTSAKVRRFYERWYRPDTMTLVVAGDLEKLDPEPLIRAAFADMPARPGARPAEPAGGKPTLAHPFFAIPEKEVAQVSIEIARAKTWTRRPHTVEQWKRELPAEYARAMLRLRFAELAKKPDAPFLRANAYDRYGFATGFGIRVLEGEALDVDATPERWKEALAFGEQELRRALEHGFDRSELEEIRANALRALDEAVEKEPTRSSGSYVGALVDAAENGSVPVAAEARRSILKPAIEALTVEACHEAFRKAWSEGTLTISASGNADFGADPTAALRELYEASAKAKVEPRAAAKTAAFAYASSPEKAGKIVARRDVAEGIVEADLANGVRVRAKKTDFKEKEILVRVRTGGGRTALAPDQAGIGFVADKIFTGGGLGKHGADDLRRLMAGKEVGTSFRLGGDALELAGSTTSEDLVMQCELMSAFLTDAGWREEGDSPFRTALPLMYDQLQHSAGGPISFEFLPEMFQGDLRFTFVPPKKAVDAATRERVKEWVAPQLATGPLEIAFVGDLDVDATLAAAARTFGTLATRDAKRHDAHRTAPLPKPGIRMTREIDTKDPKTAVMICYPVTDGRDATLRRRVDFLTDVLSDRLRVSVREKLGASYSPGAGAQLGTSFPGHGMMVIQANAEPAKVEELLEACLAVGDSLAKDGVTQEEVDRLREPIITERRDERRRNGYWARQIAEAFTRPNVLGEMAEEIPEFQKIAAEELTPIAKQYLPRERASIIVVNPKPKAGTAPANAAGEKSGG